MISVGSRVWVEFFREAQSPEADLLTSFLPERHLLVGGLIVAEVLRGFQGQREFQSAKFVSDGFEQISMGGHHVAEQAARNYRFLRERGHTIRKLIDVLIATRCIIEGTNCFTAIGTSTPLRSTWA